LSARVHGEHRASGVLTVNYEVQGSDSVEQPPDDDRAARIRQARQVLAGNEIVVPQTTSRSERRSGSLSGELRYFIALAAFVLLAAILYAIWGMTAATPVLVLLVAALLLAWFIL
jgi:Flp pilus assembly protein TadB